MIYLDEKIASHRKILRAGRLLGDRQGGTMAALGLFVAAIGYSRAHLTDGVVPDEFLQEVSRNAHAISCLHRAKLIRKLRGSRWHIHDYLAWNPSAEQVREKQRQNTARQTKFRQARKGSGGSGNGSDGGANAAVTPLRNGEGSAKLFEIPDPRSPIPDQKQRPDGRDLSPEVRRSLARTTSADDNYAVLVRLTHTVMDEHPGLDSASPDLIEAVKVAAALAKIEYNPTVLAGALRSAGMQRTVSRKNNNLVPLVERLQAAITTRTLPAALVGMQRSGRR